MRCCSNIGATRGGSDAAPQTSGHHLAAARPATGVARIRFEAAHSHIGTDRPVIAEDGEGPRRPVKLRAFELEAVTVSNARFAEFVAATDYVTEAERFGWSPVFKGLLPDSSPYAPVGTQIPWWLRVEGACWRSPEGPGSTIEGRGEHPVVQVSYNDAGDFAQWCGGRLPTEAEWEHAARGGLADPRFPWGDDEPDDHSIFCNIWQGRFPDRNTVADGFFGTSPADAFAPNHAGLYGMVGNVWEWTADAFRIRSLGKAARQRNELAARNGDRVVKGGSFLCHASYCYRYRIAARSSMSPDSSTSHTGFRICYNAAPVG